MYHIAYLAVCHAINDPLNDIFFNKVSRRVERDSSVLKLWIVSDFNAGHGYVVAADIVVFHELEQSLQTVSCPKVVVCTNVDPQHLCLVRVLGGQGVALIGVSVQYCGLLFVQVEVDAEENPN